MVRVNLNLLLKSVRLGSVKRVASNGQIGSVLMGTIKHDPALRQSWECHHSPPLSAADIDTGLSIGQNRSIEMVGSPSQPSSSQSGSRNLDRMTGFWQPCQGLRQSVADHVPLVSWVCSLEFGIGPSGSRPPVCPPRSQPTSFARGRLPIAFRPTRLPLDMCEFARVYRLDANGGQDHG